MYEYNYVPQGWQCPVCKRVYSPSVSMCMYCGNKETTGATDNITPVKYQIEIGDTPETMRSRTTGGK